jgi:fatty acid desaturase
MASESLSSKQDPQLLKPSRPSKSDRPLLKHIEDLRQIGFTALFFLVFVYAWLSFSSPLSGGLVSFITWLSLFQLSFMGAVATHNAIHTPLFYSSRLNSIYQICLSLQYGFPVSVFIPGHNLSHHKHPQQARDFSEFTAIPLHSLLSLSFFSPLLLSSSPT